MAGERYSNAAIMAGLSDVAGWLENEGGRDKHVRTIRTGIARLKELAEAAEAAEEAAYEELNAVGARVQQGWNADESVFDAARLRWLETQARKSRTGISFDWVPPIEGERSGFRFMRRFFVTEQCDTLKAAIDRAMLEDPTHATDRQIDPATEIARLVAAVTGECPAQCDGSGEAGETAGLAPKDDSTARAAGAPDHLSTPAPSQQRGERS